MYSRSLVEYFITQGIRYLLHYLIHAPGEATAYLGNKRLALNRQSLESRRLCETEWIFLHDRAERVGKGVLLEKKRSAHSNSPLAKRSGDGVCRPDTGSIHVLSSKNSLAQRACTF